jgi:hypothetical protein
VAAANALAALCIGLSRLDKPPGFWVGKETAVAWSLVIIFVAAIVLPTVSELGEKAKRTSLERRQKYQTFLASCLVGIARHSKANWETTGVQLFLVRRGGFLWLQQMHGLAATLRLQPTAHSGIRWTRGKGLIGQCWETQTVLLVNLDEYFRPYENHDEGLWRRLPPDIRYGLSFAEFQKLKGKYGVVAAAPIVSEKGRYLGCVTADMPVDNKPIAERPIKNMLVNTAVFVREVL